MYQPAVFIAMSLLGSVPLPTKLITNAAAPIKAARTSESLNVICFILL
jgi:hypothetical protein